MGNHLRGLQITAICVAGCSGRFVPATPSNPSAPPINADLVGQALKQDGTPAPDVDVYVAINQRGTKLATTDQNGRFKITDAPSGSIELVLNNRAGVGVLKEMTLIPNGQNDAGKLTLDTLEHWPTVVELSGVGYEERVTTSLSGALSPVFDSKGSFFVAARVQQNAGQSEYLVHELVKVDASTGAETVLYQPFILAPDFPRPVRLIQDRVVAYRQRNDFPSTEERWSFVDLVTGKTVHSTDSAPSCNTYEHNYCGFDPDHLSIASDQLFGVYRSFTVGSTPNELNHYTEWFTTIDLPTAEAWDTSKQRFVPIVVDETSSDGTEAIEGFSFVAFEGNSAFYSIATKHCSQATNLDCAQFASALGTLYSLNFDTLQENVIANLSSGVSLSRAAGTHFAYLVDFDSNISRSATNLHQLDLTSGALTELLHNRTDLFPFREILAAGPGVVVELAGHSTFLTSQPGIARISVPTGQVSWLAQNYTLPDGSSSITTQLCASIFGNYCNAVIHADGSVRIDDLSVGFERHELISVDFATDGTQVSQRLLPIGQLPSSDLALPPVLYTQDDTREAMLGPDVGHDFDQLHLRATNGNDGYRQVTFLSADHTTPAFSADGKWLYYFTRDPIAGETQLFRVSVE